VFSPFHGTGETPYLFVFTQFRTEGYGEVAEPKARRAETDSVDAL
jgi:hypothetical protein